MTNPKDPAFPHNDAEKHDQNACCGLTKREYFAAMAMQGVLAGGLPEAWVKGGGKEDMEKAMAKLSLISADALIAELNREPQQ